MRKRQILQDPNRPIEFGYFIEGGAASLLARTRRDGEVEVAIVGRFGFVGIAALLGVKYPRHRCLVQFPGEALKIRVGDLRNVLDQLPALRAILASYVHALLIQHSQVSLCNARHTIEERLARWLLIVRDRIESDDIPVTHDVIAQVLGVRRPGVTTMIGNFERLGAIRRERGRILVIDAERLKELACECYDIIIAEYARILESEGDVRPV